MIHMHMFLKNTEFHPKKECREHLSNDRAVYVTRIIGPYDPKSKSDDNCNCIDYPVLDFKEIAKD
jgi:hypothetical protein